MPALHAILTLLGIIFILAAVVIFRTLSFKPKSSHSVSSSPIIFDGEKAVNDLADMIRCKTVSNINAEEEDEGEFLKFESLLKTVFPNVFRKCTFEKPSRRSLLFKWEGKTHTSPLVLMGHYDVVSAEEDKWDKPAFGGTVEDGFLWGRGTIDTKCTVNAVLQSAEKLISEDFTPENDIYFAFGGDEEISGGGAHAIVSLFIERGIKPSLVIDEGGAVVSEAFPGVKEPCAFVGIAEKGMLNVKYSVGGVGGHASAPASETPIGILSEACRRLEKSPFKYRLSPAVQKLFDTVGRHSSFFFRMIFANLWCFAPLLNLISKRSGGQVNALLRTTVAFTEMEGSKGMNVIPANAYMISNQRIIHGESMDYVAERIKKTVNDERVKIEVINGMEPSVISRTDTPEYEKLEEVIKETWKNVLVSPYLMTACSDSRHFSEISDRVYRFSPLSLSNSDLDMIHGNNERISCNNIKAAVEFYIRLMLSV